jgi:hypothetical protein
MVKNKGHVIDGLTFDNTYYKCSPQTTGYHGVCDFFINAGLVAGFF